MTTPKADSPTVPDKEFIEPKLNQLIRGCNKTASAKVKQLIQSLLPRN